MGSNRAIAALGCAGWARQDKWAFLGQSQPFPKANGFHAYYRRVIHNNLPCLLRTERAGASAVGNLIPNVAKYKP